MRTDASALPRPGPRWGQRPMRAGAARPGTTWSYWGWRALPARAPAALVLPWHRRWIEDVRQRTALASSAAAPGPQGWQDVLSRARLALRRDGLSPATVAEGLACVEVALARCGGHRLHDLQLVAVAGLMDRCLVEMATGEGKSLVMAAAAALGGLAGVPVHLLTANDYLAERDAQALKPLAEALGLTVAHLPPLCAADDKRRRYQADIVCTTAKEVAFDLLRDEMASPGSGHEQPVLRGLCLALIDEADSILLDEAVVPLVISEAQPEPANRQAGRRALWWQARRLASQLQEGGDFHGHSALLKAVLTPAGQDHVAQLTAGLDGLWRRATVREELVCLALAADRLLQRDRHYLVRDGRIELLDSVTGRVAPGRVWSQGLQALIELKEGCTPSPATRTLSQITFQRFFQRYWRVGGVSGTLVEARGELLDVHGLRVRRVPLRVPSRRTVLPVRVFVDPTARWQAVVERARALSADGRPVLIGTDSVADSEALSGYLTQAGLAHTVLNARHDSAEAAIIQQAGEAGRITVATRMAGRGTDIQPDAQALAAGGLHVIHCQRNENRRMDRQLLGRTARQGQPGSAETWICAVNSAERTPIGAPKLSRCSSSVTGQPGEVSWGVLRLACRILQRIGQRIEEHRQAALRRHLLEQDRQWEEVHQHTRGR